MANGLDQIKGPIARELDIFEKRFRDTLRSPVPLMDRITYYIVRRKGKQMRPMFTFFSAEACGGINDATYTAASLIELVHTASLVHDDVVDESYERRGFFSINALWKNKIAVLVGDYFLARGLSIALETKQYRTLEISSRLVSPEGRPPEIQGVARDVTERRRLELQLHQAQKLRTMLTKAGFSEPEEL